MRFNNNLKSCKHESWRLARVLDIEEQEKDYIKSINPYEDFFDRKKYVECLKSHINRSNDGERHFLGNCVASHNILKTLPTAELLSIISFVKDYARHYEGCFHNIYFIKPSLSFLYLVECFDDTMYYDYFDDVGTDRFNILESLSNGKWENYFYLKFAHEPYDKLYYQMNICDSYKHPPKSN